MTIRLSEEELQAILAEAEAEIKEVLKSESARLAKAQEPGEEGAPDEGSAPPMDEGSAPMDEGSAPPMEGTGAPPMDEGSAPPPGPEGSAPAGDPAAEQGATDPAALEAEYSQLPPEELKVHYMAVKSALFKLMGAGPDAGAGPEGSAPPAPAPAGPPPGGPAPAPAMKGEMSAGKQVSPSPGNGGKLGKSETARDEALEQLKAELKKNEEHINLLATALDKALTTPLRKAVTTVAHVPKGEEDKSTALSLSKSEIAEKLSEKARDPKLAKSDRDLINKFYVGAVDVVKLQHLLQ